MSNIKKIKSPLNFGQPGGENKHSVKKLNSTTVHAAPEEDNPKKEPFILIEYKDNREQLQRRILKRNKAFMFNIIWEHRKVGITQKDVPCGFTCKNYVFDFASCKKYKFYIPFKRKSEINRYGHHKRYWITGEITIIDENGFPNLRKYISKN